MNKQLELKRKMVNAIQDAAYEVCPGVNINIPGQFEFTLEYNLRAVKNVLKNTGVNLLEGVSPDDMKNPDTFMELLFQGLQKYHSAEITSVEQLEDHPVGSLKYLNYVSASVGLAIQAVMPDSDVMKKIMDDAAADIAKQAGQSAEDSDVPLPQAATSSTSGPTLE